MNISEMANGKPEASAVGSLYISFIDTTNSALDAACPLANEIANCLPAARHVKNVTAKSRIASHNFFGFGSGAGVQAGITSGLSGAARFKSIVGAEKSFSLFTEL